VREGSRIVVIEANVCGTPAVGWSVPGAQDSIIHGTTGLHVPFANIESLAKSIMKVLSDSQRFAIMSKSAIDWARQHSWDVAAEKSARIVESVI